MPSLPFTFLVTFLALFASAGPSTAGKGEPIVIPQDPLGLVPGAPLSSRTLVQRPPGIKDVRSWTMETKRHRGYLMTSAVSPDGKLVATGGLDGIIRIWDVDSGAFVRALVGHGSYVYGLAFSPDGRTLASAGSFDATARLWDMASGMPLRVLKGHKGYAYHVAWSADGKHVAVSGGTSGFITLWDVQKQMPENTIEVGTTPSGLAWAPDGQSIAIAGQAFGVGLWNLRTGKATATVPLPKNVGHAVAWSPDGKTLAAGGQGKTVLWDPATAKIRQELDVSGIALAWSPDGKSLAIATGAEIQVRGGDFSKAEATMPFAGVRVGWARPDLIVAADSALLTCAAPDQPKKLRHLLVSGNSSLVWMPGRPVISGLHSIAPELWDPATGKHIGALKGHTGGVLAAAWSRDGKLLASAATDKTVRLWDPTGAPIRTLEGHEGPVQCLAWGEGKMLASGSADKTIRIWPGAGEQPARILKGHTDAVTALAWTREGTQLASGGAEDKVHLWSAAGGKPVNTLHTTGMPRSLSWSPGPKFLAVGMETGATYFYSAAGKALGHFEGGGSPPAVTGLAWTGEQTAVAGRANHTVQVLRPGSPKALLNFTVMSPVTSVGVSGDHFVLGGTDRAARWYDVAKGNLQLTVIVDEKQAALVNGFGHFKCPDEAACELVYVVQTNKGQETLDVKDFAAKYKWKNNPALVQAPGK